MSDLTARLLAEIERREERFPTIRSLCSADQSRELAYLAALREVVDRHQAVSPHTLPWPSSPGVSISWSRNALLCSTCREQYPCPDVRAVATALDVTP